MSVEDTIDTINGVYLVLYGFGLFVSLATLIRRTLRYFRSGKRLPILLPRDLILLLGLAVPIGGILIVRYTETASLLRENLLWITLTGGLAVFSIWVWMIYELFVIDRPAKD
jgi:uncharacterized membrane protein